MACFSNLGTTLQLVLVSIRHKVTALVQQLKTFFNAVVLKVKGVFKKDTGLGTTYHFPRLPLYAYKIRKEAPK